MLSSSPVDGLEDRGKPVELDAVPSEEEERFEELWDLTSSPRSTAEATGPIPR